MALYAYRGRSGGALVSGEIEADDRPTAVAQLRARGVVATAVQERPAKITTVKKISGKVKDKDLAIYTRQFSTMVDAGLPIAQCLAILSEQSDSKALRDVRLDATAITDDGLAELAKLPNLEHLILSYPGSAVVPEARRELERAKGAIPKS